MVSITTRTSPFPSYLFLHIECIMRVDAHTCVHGTRLHARKTSSRRSSHTYHLCLLLLLFFFSLGKSKPPSLPPGTRENYCWSGPSPPIPSFPSPPSLPTSPHSHLCSDSADKPLNKITPRPSPFRPPGTTLPLLADRPAPRWLDTVPMGLTCGVLSASPLFSNRESHTRKEVVAR
jgi:hypothetical protein